MAPLIDRTRSSTSAYPHWSNWRRTSQARARISHHKRRHHNLSLSYLVTILINGPTSCWNRFS
ncbi:hypothetical protein ALI22I_02615 [Saccharothrix sp. ALI-22-I]|nr:hypothetical protein ALI22I_02615 [Saccharothrix sp. ALI-22-I]